MRPTALIVLYDGHCPLCHGIVKFLLDRDGRDVFRFAPLQSSRAQARIHESGLDSDTDSMIVIEGEQIYVRSDAAIKIAEALPGIWRAGAWLKYLPYRQRDALYRWIARNRYRWFGRYSNCRLPKPEERNKFIWQDTDEHDTTQSFDQKP